MKQQIEIRFNKTRYIRLFLFIIAIQIAMVLLVFLYDFSQVENFSQILILLRFAVVLFIAYTSFIFIKQRYRFLEGKAFITISQEIIEINSEGKSYSFDARTKEGLQVISRTIGKNHRKFLRINSSKTPHEIYLGGLDLTPDEVESLLHDWKKSLVNESILSS